MGLLVFCTTRAEVKAVAASLSGIRVKQLVGGFSSFEVDVIPFIRGEVDVLVTTDRSLVTGWHAPPGTVVLFSSTFPEGPERIQAAARVRDTGATGGW